MKKTSLPLFSFLLLAACGGHDGAQPATGLLSASPSAHGYGIDHYTVDGNQAAIFGTDGNRLATLVLSAPTADTRRVVISYLDGNESTTDVTRPVDGAFLLTPVGDNREGAALSDPALAPLFLTQKLAFHVVLPPLERRSEQQLDPSAWAVCSNFGAVSPWPPGCYTDYCTGYYQFYTEATHTYHSTLVGYGHCPRSACASNYAADKVQKTEWCDDPGSCSFQANGQVGCYACAASCPSGAVCNGSTCCGNGSCEYTVGECDSNCSADCTGISCQ